MNRIVQGAGVFGAWLVAGILFVLFMGRLDEGRNDSWERRRILDRADEIRAQRAAGEEIWRKPGERSRREQPEDILEEADEIRSAQRIRMAGAVTSYLLGTLVFGGLGLYAYRRWELDSDDEADFPYY